MPNHVRNIVKMKGITALPLFTEKEDYDGKMVPAFDFNKIIPMPESLNVESGSVEDTAIEVAMRRIGRMERRFERGRVAPGMSDERYQTAIGICNKTEFKRWPQFEKAYLWAFERMLEGRSFDKWKTKYDVMDWYIYGAEKDCAALADGRQISLFSEDYFDQFDAGEDAYPFSADDARRIILGEFARAPLGKGV